VLIYCARIIAIGLTVRNCLARNMLVTSASHTLESHVLSLEKFYNETNLLILPGDRLFLASKSYLITAVGRAAQKTLFDTGEVCMMFNGELNAGHTCSLYLSGPAPDVQDLNGTLVIEEGWP